MTITAEQKAVLATLLEEAANIVAEKDRLDQIVETVCADLSAQSKACKEKFEAWQASLVA